MELLALAGTSFRVSYTHVLYILQYIDLLLLNNLNLLKMKQCKQKCQEKKTLTNLQIIQKKELLVGKKKHVQIIYYSLIIHYWTFVTK